MKKFLLGLLIPMLFMGNANAKQTLTGNVLEIHDGDTFSIITCDGFKLKVRMCGVDAPELKQEYGVEAQGFLKNLLTSHQVKIVTDKQEFDPYGRILGYVYLNDNFVNLTMVKEGLALSERVPPNLVHFMEFNTAEQLATKELKGFWKTGGLKQRPREFRQNKIK